MGNLSLSHLGVGQEIASLTEKSEPARAINSYYDFALENVLSAFDWSFARRYLELALVEENPTIEFGYSYRLPTDVILVRKLLSGVRNETRQSRVTYHMGADEQGRLILTDLDTPTAKCTVKVEDIQNYPATFKLAFSYFLASLIAPRVTKQDPFKMRERLLQLYMIEMGKASAQNAEENQYDEEPRSEFERVRY